MVIVDGRLVAEKNDANTTAALEQIIEILGATDENIAELQSLMGDADATVINAIKSLYDALGGISFSVDPETNCLVATYDDGVVST